MFDMEYKQIYQYVMQVKHWPHYSVDTQTSNSIRSTINNKRSGPRMSLAYLLSFGSVLEIERLKSPFSPSCLQFLCHASEDKVVLTLAESSKCHRHLLTARAPLPALAGTPGLGSRTRLPCHDRRVTFQYF